jgi:hypothetical protein
MKPKEPTHLIVFQMEGGYAHQQHAYGKTDLFSILREMMKDGYTTFQIKTLKKAAQ